MSSPKTGKFLINCQEGTNHIERASISFTLAASVSKTAETVVFATSNAAYLCVNYGAIGIQHPGMESIENLIDQFINNGGKIWLCPICAKVKGIVETDLREGVEIAGAPRTMAYLESGAMLLV